MSASPSRRLVDLATAASEYGVHSRTIRRRVADGTVTGYRLARSRSIRVDLNELDAVFLQPIPAAPAARRRAGGAA